MRAHFFLRTFCHTANDWVHDLLCFGVDLKLIVFIIEINTNRQDQVFRDKFCAPKTDTYGVEFGSIDAYPTETTTVQYSAGKLHPRP